MVNFLEIFGTSTALTVVASLILKSYLTETIKNSVRTEYDKDFEQFKTEIRKLESQANDKWNLKRAACLQALELADNTLSNLMWNGIDNNQMIKGKIDTLEARKIYNALATTCDSDKVLKLLKFILTGDNKDGIKINLGVIVDFRNAVREELGFGKIVDEDMENAFFVRLHGQK